MLLSPVSCLWLLYPDCHHPVLQTFGEIFSPGLEGSSSDSLPSRISESLARRAPSQGLLHLCPASSVWPLHATPDFHAEPPFNTFCCHQSFRRHNSGLVGGRETGQGCTAPFLGVPKSSPFLHSFGKHLLSTTMYQACARGWGYNGPALKRLTDTEEKPLEHSTPWAIRVGFKGH